MQRIDFPQLWNRSALQLAPVFMRVSRGEKVRDGGCGGWGVVVLEKQLGGKT